MALDNLLVWGNSYLRRAPSFTITIPFTGISIPVGLDTLLQTVLVAVLPILLIPRPKAEMSQARIPAFLWHVGRRGVAILIYALIVCLCAVLSVSAFRWMPFNWGGVLTVGITIIGQYLQRETGSKETVS